MTGIVGLIPARWVLPSTVATGHMVYGHW